MLCLIKKDAVRTVEIDALEEDFAFVVLIQIIFAFSPVPINFNILRFTCPFPYLTTYVWRIESCIDKRHAPFFCSPHTKMYSLLPLPSSYWETPPSQWIIIRYDLKWFLVLSKQVPLVFPWACLSHGEIQHFHYQLSLKWGKCVWGGRVAPSILKSGVKTTLSSFSVHDYTSL